MRVLLTSEAKFERTSDGTIWASTPNGCSMWSQHLEVFSAVLVLARVADVREPSPGVCSGIRHGSRFCPLFRHIPGSGVCCETVRVCTRS